MGTRRRSDITDAQRLTLETQFTEVERLINQLSQLSERLERAAQGVSQTFSRHQGKSDGNATD